VGAIIVPTYYLDPEMFQFGPSGQPEALIDSGAKSHGGSQVFGSVNAIFSADPLDSQQPIPEPKNTTSGGGGGTLKSTLMRSTLVLADDTDPTDAVLQRPNTTLLLGGVSSTQNLNAKPATVGQTPISASSTSPRTRPTLVQATSSKGDYWIFAILVLALVYFEWRKHT
jgi:hypothetical protein